LLAEKKSLRRFLLVYVFSTMILIAIGEMFYYRLALHSVIRNSAISIQQQLGDFLKDKKFKLLIYSKSPIKLDSVKYGVFVDGKYLYGDVRKNIDKPFELKDKKLYFKKSFFKRWGRVDIVFLKDISDKLSEIKKELFIFGLFAFVFVLITAFFLGKMFLKPMKDVIDDLESFIRDSTHEMNTPISVILSNIEMLNFRDPESKEIKRIKNAALRLSRIFSDLSYIRLHNKIKSVKKNIDVSSFLQQRLEMFETTVENKGFKLKLETDECIINANEEDLTRVIDNLLSNAFKYAPKSSVIAVTLKECVLEIVNEGEIRDVKAVLQKFTREDSAEGGFGLGLYIVSQICEKNGWEFEIKSSNSKVMAKVKFK